MREISLKRTRIDIYEIVHKRDITLSLIIYDEYKLYKIKIVYFAYFYVFNLYIQNNA